MLLLFLSTLLNKLHGVCPTWELEPSFPFPVCAWVSGMLRDMKAPQQQARHLQKCSGNEQMVGDLAVTCRVQCYRESRSPPGSLPGSNRAERPHGFKAQFCCFLLCDTEQVALSYSYWDCQNVWGSFLGLRAHHLQTWRGSLEVMPSGSKNSTSAENGSWKVGVGRDTPWWSLQESPPRPNILQLHSRSWIRWLATVNISASKTCSPCLVLQMTQHWELKKKKNAQKPS